jgi:hypothetical protein
MTHSLCRHWLVIHVPCILQAKETFNYVSKWLQISLFYVTCPLLTQHCSHVHVNEMLRQDRNCALAVTAIFYRDVTALQILSLLFICLTLCNCFGRQSRMEHWFNALNRKELKYLTMSPSTYALFWYKTSTLKKRQRCHSFSLIFSSVQGETVDSWRGDKFISTSSRSDQSEMKIATISLIFFKGDGVV